jgi:hypothetical protein
MDSGARADCDTLVERPVYRVISDTSLAIDVAFRPMAIALEAAIEETNRAITLFEDACGRPELFVTKYEIEDALAEIQAANRNYILVFSLLRSFESH